MGVAEGLWVVCGQVPLRGACSPFDRALAAEAKEPRDLLDVLGGFVQFLHLRRVQRVEKRGSHLSGLGKLSFPIH